MCYLPLNLVGLGMAHTGMLVQLFTLLSHCHQQREVIGSQRLNVEQSRVVEVTDGLKQAVKLIALNA